MMKRSDFPQSISKGKKMKKPKMMKSGSKLKGAGAQKGSKGAGMPPAKPEMMNAPPMPFRKGGAVKGKC
jgi:ribosomal protein L19E